jgi:PhnB protein
MADKINAIPVGPRAITAYLTIKGAAAGIEYYKKAFGAKELMRWTGPDGRVGHAEIEINGTPVFISDEQWGTPRSRSTERRCSSATNIRK